LTPQRAKELAANANLIIARIKAAKAARSHLPSQPKKQLPISGCGDGFIDTLNDLASKETNSCQQ
jgi:hypothetical protein